MGKSWDSFNEVVEPKGAYQNEKGFSKLPRNKANGMYDFMLPRWKEALRILKDGAFAFVMCAPRQDVLSEQIRALTDAGFNMGFSSIYWTYSSGFPKSANIGKMIDKRAGAERKVIGENPNQRNRHNAVNVTSIGGKSSTNMNGYNLTLPATPEAKHFNGWHVPQVKPAVEIIIVCQKPMSEKTYVAQALNNEKGCWNIDECRIPYASTYDQKHQDDIRKGEGTFFGGSGKSMCDGTVQGRFPANLLVSDNVLDNGKTTGGGTFPSKRGPSAMFGLGDADNRNDFVGTMNDNGGYSRYFSLDRWAEEHNISEVENTFPFLIIPKASKKEKNKGCEGLEEKEINGRDEGQDAMNVPQKQRPANMKNNHPTVKPLKLMSYLISLASRKGDVVLDPFLGSGTTGVAALALGRRFIGIEQSSEYFAICEARLKSAI